MGKCWECGIRVGDESEYLHFCSRACQEAHTRKKQEKQKKGWLKTPKKINPLLIPIRICAFLYGLVQFIGGFFVVISLLSGVSIESGYGIPGLLGLLFIAIGILVMVLAIKGAITFDGDT